MERGRHGKEEGRKRRQWKAKGGKREPFQINH